MIIYDRYRFPVVRLNVAHPLELDFGQILFLINTLAAIKTKCFGINFKSIRQFTNYYLALLLVAITGIFFVNFQS